MCGSLGFGGDRADIKNIPDPPPIKEMMDFFNYVTGTQTVTVTGADGKKQRITTRVPHTPEELRVLQPARDMLVSSINGLARLSKYNKKSAIPFAPLIDAVADMSDQTLNDLGQFANLGDLQEKRQEFRDVQRSIIDEQFAMDRMANEERLAHSGRGSGTYAAESRAAMSRAHGLARAEGDARAVMGAEDYAAKRLGTDTNAFNLRQGGRQGAVDAVKTDYGLNKMDEQDQEARRQQAMQETKGLFDVGKDVSRYDDWKALQDKTGDQSLNTYLAENNVQNARYGAQVNAINANNQAAQNEYNNRGPSFGEWAMGTAGKIGGAMFTDSPDTMAGRAGKKISGAFGF